MNSSVEETYLEAETDFKNNAYVDAYRKYESILYEQPDHAPSHNSLGFLYRHHFDDYVKAENHFLTAMRCNPLYPHPYFHYAVLLTDMERYTELEKHLDKCLEISTLEKSWIYAKKGVAKELNLFFAEAIKYYEKAILITLSEEKMKEYNQDIDRCKSKELIVQ